MLLYNTVLDNGNWPPMENNHELWTVPDCNVTSWRMGCLVYASVWRYLLWWIVAKMKCHALLMIWSALCHAPCQKNNLFFPLQSMWFLLTKKNLNPGEVLTTIANLIPHFNDFSILIVWSSHVHLTSGNNKN